MKDHRSKFVHRAPALLVCLELAACAGDDGVKDPRLATPAVATPAASTPEGSGPFKSLAPAANAPAVFSQPRAGVPLEGGAVAFVAVDAALPDTALPDTASSDTVSPDRGADPTGPRSAVFLQPPAEAGQATAAPRVLYAGADLVSPLDIEASLDQKSLFIADYAGGARGTGAILHVSTSGDSQATLADGWSPRSVTLGPDEALYFSGVDPDTGEPGVFRLRGDAVEPVYVGSPLVDPSGIAVFRDGRVLVADTRLLDGGALLADVTASEAGVVLIDGGRASVFATGFATGFPAGVALTLDESTLIISGQGPDRSDTVYLVDVAAPREAPRVVQDAFSSERDSSAGLKRAHDANTFIWSSLSFNGGTVFRIDG
jgi:hypothetical protein